MLISGLKGLNEEMIFAANYANLNCVNEAL